jgi:signal recognition particle subunit SRP54
VRLAAHVSGWNRFIKQFEQTQKMMKQFGGGKKGRGGMGGMFGGGKFPGMGGRFF